MERQVSHEVGKRQAAVKKRAEKFLGDGSGRGVGTALKNCEGLKSCATERPKLHLVPRVIYEYQYQVRSNVLVPGMAYLVENMKACVVQHEVLLCVPRTYWCWMG